MTEIADLIIQTTIDSFDFTFCIIVNVLTYVIIKLWDDINLDKPVTKWNKRIAFLGALVFVSIAYLFSGTDPKLLLNSAILAPVSWSWIFKPICSKLNIDYKKFIN